MNTAASFCAAFRVATVHRGEQPRRVAVRRHDDADHVRPSLEHPREELDAAHPRHPLVGEQDRDVVPRQDGQRLGPALRREDTKMALEL
jgi:hypothetical protein